MYKVELKQWRLWMKLFFSSYIAALLCCFNLNAFTTAFLGNFSEKLLEISTPVGDMVVYRPNFEEMRQTAFLAKAVFIEAFSTTYTEYHRQSGAIESIDRWLRLKPGLTLHSWLSFVFDEEYEGYLAGNTHFLYLCDSQGTLIGWLSHKPVSETGEMYLSQCSLEADYRNRKIASSVFGKVFEGQVIKQLFPNAKEVKLIARKINEIAKHLYIKAGFIMDETIDPSVYGDSYDDRYIGFRFSLEP